MDAKRQLYLRAELEHHTRGLNVSFPSDPLKAQQATRSGLHELLERLKRNATRSTYPRAKRFFAAWYAEVTAATRAPSPAPVAQSAATPRPVSAAVDAPLPAVPAGASVPPRPARAVVAAPRHLSGSVPVSRVQPPARTPPRALPAADAPVILVPETQVAARPHAPDDGMDVEESTASTSPSAEVAGPVDTHQC